MSNIHYLLQAGYSLNPKNNYQKAIQEFIQCINRNIIDDVPVFKAYFQMELDKIHANHHRCKKETIWWNDPMTENWVYEPHHKPDFHVTIGGITLHLLIIEPSQKIYVKSKIIL